MSGNFVTFGSLSLLINQSLACQVMMMKLLTFTDRKRESVNGENKEKRIATQKPFFYFFLLKFHLRS